jgi:Fe-S cluster biogenesis protein NfuA
MRDHALVLQPISLLRRQSDDIIEKQSMNSAETQLPVRDRVQGVINLIRPAVQADGGDIELVDVADDGTVQIRFHGACHGCPSSNLTLHMGIERNLREKIPEVTRVVPVK